MQFQRLILDLGDLLVQLDVFRGSSGLQAILQHGQLGAVALLLLMYVVCADARQQVWLIAVHIDQALEAVLLAGGEEPVNRPLLVNLQVVGIEVVQEVIPDHLAGVPLPPNASQ